MDQWDLSLTCDDSMTFLNGMFQGIPVCFWENLSGRCFFFLVIIDQSQWKQLQVASADSHKSNNIILKLR